RASASSSTTRTRARGADMGAHCITQGARQNADGSNAMTKYASPAESRVISVGGGKGGVGKSVIAANLAGTLAQAGRKVVPADPDLGAPSQHLLLGVTSCRPGVRPLLEGSDTDVERALTPTAIANLSLLAGTDGACGAANLSRAGQERLLAKLRALN